MQDTCFPVNAGRLFAAAPIVARCASNNKTAQVSCVSKLFLLWRPVHNALPVTEGLRACHDVVIGDYGVLGR